MLLEREKQLEGWKNIAAYFKRGPRTVQLWERDCGLPIHRFQGRVLAYPQELDQWRLKQQIRPRAGSKAIRANSAA